MLRLCVTCRCHGALLARRLCWHISIMLFKSTAVVASMAREVWAHYIVHIYIYVEDKTGPQTWQALLGGLYLHRYNCEPFLEAGRKGGHYMELTHIYGFSANFSYWKHNMVFSGNVSSFMKGPTIATDTGTELEQSTMHTEYKPSTRDAQRAPTAL